MEAKNNRYAVVDLGTNTFHLLVAERGEQHLIHEIYRERQFVKLAEEGIQTIANAPYQRGIEALSAFAHKIEELHVNSIKVFGTAALRTASNGEQFIQDVKQKTGLSIELITGDEEARLIHLGVGLAVPFDASKSIIMDIGGGSVEFIIADEKQVYWAKSFPVGVAVLFKQFHHADPITEQEIAAVNAFLDEQLAPLLLELPKHDIKTLIGASGAFEVVDNMLPQYRQHPLYTLIPIHEYWPLYDDMMPKSLEERLKTEGLPAKRADLIIVAYLLIYHLLSKTSIHLIAISAYAVKEGMLSEMMETNNF